MNSQLLNLPAVAAFGASIYFAQEVKFNAPSARYSVSCDVENSNASNATGLKLASIDFAALEEANVFESKVEASEQAEMETIFNGLAKKWREETGGYSLTMRRYAHGSYQSILALEPKREVISLILLELQERPDRWFEALKALAKTNPAQDSKTFDETVKSWIKWGKAEKYIS